MEKSQAGTAANDAEEWTKSWSSLCGETLETITENEEADLELWEEGWNTQPENVGSHIFGNTHTDSTDQGPIWGGATPVPSGNHNRDDRQYLAPGETERVEPSQENTSSNETVQETTGSIGYTKPTHSVPTAKETAKPARLRTY
eukprot:12745091-Heterocapsa_arctica.AAC.1